MGFVFSKMLGKPLFRSAYYVVSRKRNIKLYRSVNLVPHVFVFENTRIFMDYIVNARAFWFVFSSYDC